MKPLLLVFLCVLLTNCGSSKPIASSAAKEENKLVLPPDVPSNKYSKTRQAKRN